jgi:hypothetical protein
VLHEGARSDKQMHKQASAQADKTDEPIGGRLARKLRGSGDDDDDDDDPPLPGKNRFPVSFRPDGRRPPTAPGGGRFLCISSLVLCACTDRLHSTDRPKGPRRRRIETGRRPERLVVGDHYPSFPACEVRGNARECSGVLPGSARSILKSRSEAKRGRRATGGKRVTRWPLDRTAQLVDGINS